MCLIFCYETPADLCRETFSEAALLAGKSLGCGVARIGKLDRVKIVLLYRNIACYVYIKKIPGCRLDYICWNSLVRLIDCGVERLIAHQPLQAGAECSSRTQSPPTAATPPLTAGPAVAAAGLRQDSFQTLLINFKSIYLDNNVSFC